MTLLKIVFDLNLILLALDHLVTGSYGLFFPIKAIRMYKHLYGAEIPETREYFIILKPWGALGIFAGLVGLLPVLDPQKYFLILIALVILLVMRLIYRLALQKETEKHLKLSKKSNLRSIGLIVTCGLVIVLQIILL